MMLQFPYFNKQSNMMSFITNNDAFECFSNRSSVKQVELVHQTGLSAQVGFFKLQPELTRNLGLSFLLH